MDAMWMPDSPILRLAWLKRLSGGGGEEPVYKTVSGNPVTFSAVAAPLQQLKVDFAPVQAGSGAVSPSNERPISGWTGLTATVNGAAAPVTWQTEAGTVYGGYVDPISGDLVAEWSAVTYTGAAAEDWQLETTGLYKIYRSGIVSTDAADVSSVLSSYLPAAPRSSIYGGSVTDGICLRGGAHIWVRAGSVVSDLAGWKAYLADHPLQVAYKLATPIHYQLTPQTIRTIRGSNTISSNGGSMTVTYRES